MRRFGLALLLLAACGSERTPPVSNDAGVVNGSLLVKWHLEDPAHNALTCADASIPDAEIAIGGSPITVSCADGQVHFADLLPQRYPVFIRLKLAGTTVEQASGNVIVEAGKEATVDLLIVVTTGPGSAGSLDINWRIEGEAAADGCPKLNGKTVTVESGETAREPFFVNVACGNGHVLIKDLPPGVYDVKLTLFDANAQKITSNLIPGVIVRGGDTAKPDVVNLIIPGAVLGNILAQWTVSGTVASIGCGRVGAEKVKLQFVQAAAVGTSTSCISGQMVLPRLRADNTFDLEFVLLSPPVEGTPLVVTSTIVYHIRVNPNRTSTVSVDLTP